MNLLHIFKPTLFSPLPFGFVRHHKLYSNSFSLIIIVFEEIRLQNHYDFDMQTQWNAYFNLKALMLYRYNNALAYVIMIITCVIKNVK